MIKTRVGAWTIVGVIMGSLIAVSAGYGQEDKTKSLLGTWDVQTEDGQYAFVWKFVLDKGNLAGTSTGSSGEFKMENLKFENNHVTFAVNVNQSMVITYSAVIDGETLKGSLSLQYGDANITGKKRK